MTKAALLQLPSLQCTRTFMLYIKESLMNSIVDLKYGERTVVS
jgi:hypothetical protein